MWKVQVGGIWGRGILFLRSTMWKILFIVTLTSPCVSSQLGQILFLKNFQKDLQVSRSIQAILTHWPWMVTRWCAIPTDWTFSVNCGVTPSCLELFRLPFHSEAFSIQLVISVSLRRVPFKIWFFFFRMGKITELLLRTLVCIFPAL